jgi:hypothetical protein
MKKILVLIFLLLFPAISFSQPSIVFNTETFDFGTVTKTEKIEHTFDFKNGGNEELVIQRLQPG